MTDPSTPAVLVGGGLAAIGLLQGLILFRLEKIGSIADKLAEKVQKHELTLYGPMGDNGHEGRLRGLEGKPFTRRASDIA